MASDGVDRWKCKSWGIYACACEDLRKTEVYDPNNRLVIECSRLCSCRDASMDGTPIHTSFATVLPRLQEDCD